MLIGQVKSTSVWSLKPLPGEKHKKNGEVLLQYLQTTQVIDKWVKIQPRDIFDVFFSSYLLR